MKSQAIAGVFPAETAERVRAAFLSAEYRRRDQRVSGNYSGLHRFTDPTLPSGAETYTARFSRSKSLERDPGLLEACERHVRPQLERLAGRLGALDLRCHRMDAGDHFRAHVDQAEGDVGFTVYLCKHWRWDWGGLLIAVEDGEARAFLPRFNELVVMDAAARTPHFVSAIAPHALEPRLVIVGFAGRA
jgi:Rps23 Pro-64 3,4-dihydroxylase Tpa1-like proline 4-hydroxylase